MIFVLAEILPSLTLETIAAVAIAAGSGFFIGFLMNKAKMKKQRREILSLEDEMLRNHDRILKTEKENSELSTELRVIRDELGITKKPGLKVS